MSDKTKIRRVYLDHNATTPVHPEVLAAMLPYYRETFGNASSIHWFGQGARAGLDAARQILANALGAEPEEVIFTGSGTEADNLAIKGVAEALEKKGKHLITSRIEHPAVLGTCRYLEERGWSVTYLPVDHYGLVRPESLAEALRPDTVLVSVMYANNELGTIQPVAELAKLAHRAGALFHTDAVQALGKLNCNRDRLDADLVSVSAHKVYGPKGVGALAIRKGTRLRPQMHGGHHEFSRRAGTENVAGIVGFGAAVARIMKVRESENRRQRALIAKLEKGITSRLDEVIINGHPEERLPNTLNVGFRYVEGESVLLNLDLDGIAVSTGSACSSGSTEPSHVLTAIGCPPADAQGTVRFSLGEGTTDDEIEYTLAKLIPIIERLRSMSPIYAARK